MPFQDGAGQASGLSTLTGDAALLLGPGGVASGAALTSGANNLLLAPGGQAFGQANVSGQANLIGVLAGQAQGEATVIGDYRVNASGIAAGEGLLTGTGSILHGGQGTAAGETTLSGTGGLIILVTGKTAGEGDTSFDISVTTDGHASGLATVHGTGLRILHVTGRIFGSSRMVFSYPLPIFGRGTLVGHAVVDRIAPPINAIVAPSKCFRYLEHFQRGDLPIFLSNHAGPVSPVRVVFTLYWVRPDGSRLQVGPANRTPIRGVVGEFYATGRAGESGQPGEWVIRWEFQRTFQSATQCKEMSFRVLDAVLAANPQDATHRCRKFGWN